MIISEDAEPGKPEAEPFSLLVLWLIALISALPLVSIQDRHNILDLFWIFKAF
jgi:hypothetical protein